MELSNLKPPAGAVKDDKRIGRGPGSGRGQTSGKGHKGQKARSGPGIRRGFEGGQMPLQRRLPKRGFFNKFKKQFAIVKISDLAKFGAGTVIDPQALIEAGLIKGILDGVKVLANGELQAAITVKAHKFTKNAAKKIVDAGGSVEEL